MLCNHSSTQGPVRIDNLVQNSTTARFFHVKAKAEKSNESIKPNSMVCSDCEGNGAILCSQCKGSGVNSADLFNGQFKAVEERRCCAEIATELETQHTSLPSLSKNPTLPHKLPQRGTHQSIQLQTVVSSQSYIRNSHGWSPQQHCVICFPCTVPGEKHPGEVSLVQPWLRAYLVTKPIKCAVTVFISYGEPVLWS
ncbi:DnaJ/Hsp40 cysteine-rich domain superfamily protein [Prunus dulcis]|uniref:DnaJ/Hsp40 cysteine-rich domain superfamily protein n=1 Tax=Prunus dulcis TaxID=3755 RepID=A0A4Y1QUG7_PRUDU|nr:DnaJ/Hsp40 cysteine-rich domain superfamily protein [Prunus dulcis]